MTPQGSRQGLGEIVDERSRPNCAEWSREGTPKSGTQVLASCATLGQLDYFTALVRQQHSKQSTLREGQRRFFHNDHNVWTSEARNSVWDLSRTGDSALQSQTR